MKARFETVINSIDNSSPSLGKYANTLKSTIRKLRDKCDQSNSDDLALLINNYEGTFACLRKVTPNDTTLKSNISHLVGVFRRYAPWLLPLVSADAAKFWNHKIGELDKSIRGTNPERDEGEDASWADLSWDKIVAGKRKLTTGTFERLAVDVYTTSGLPPRRGEWAHVVIYDTQNPTDRPPEQNWMHIPARGARGAFVEFNSFKTLKHLRPQRIDLPAEIVRSVRETMKRNDLVAPANMFGMDNFSAQTQSNKFNALLMRALNLSLKRTDIRRPANLFRHMFLTDLFHHRLATTTDEELKHTLRQMGTSLEQAMFTYRIVKARTKTGGANLAGMSTSLKLAMFDALKAQLDPAFSGP